MKISRLSFKTNRSPKKHAKGFVLVVGDMGLKIAENIHSAWRFVVGVFSALKRIPGGHTSLRRVDLWREIDKAGPRAVPIICLISFMVGLIIAFVGNMQLKLFGAEIYVAALVAISMIRILGAVMTGIIMAGRTGASYAAEIGSMRANQEIDALETMGISPIDFLVLPRVLALTITMPILTIIADVVAIFGGMCVAVAIMNVSVAEYWKTTLEWITFNNFAIGVLHGWLFGWVIAIIGCRCGMTAERTADGIGRSTTRAVVYGIVGCVITTAILTLVFNWIDI
ncbi:MAG: ABC transporter permease [Alphaproteobacteria bacterium]|nr:ABC transporter permease [Alphaproteobacteria bacterium]